MSTHFESQASAAFGIVCALPGELGSLRERSVATRTRQGLEIFDIECGRTGRMRALATVSGVGKVAAARAAAVLLAEGVARALFVVGTCGGLRTSLAPGTLVHCTRAAQVDLGSRHYREIDSDPTLRAHWRRVAPGVEGWFLTADMPVLSLWRRVRLARAFAGP